MALSTQPQGRPAVRPGDSALAARLARELEGEVLFDAFSRGLYSTDASIYQIEPIGVVVPKSAADITAAIQIAEEHGVPVLPRCRRVGPPGGFGMGRASTCVDAPFGCVGPRDHSSLWRNFSLNRDQPAGRSGSPD